MSHWMCLSRLWRRKHSYLEVLDYSLVATIVVVSGCDASYGEGSVMSRAWQWVYMLSRCNSRRQFVFDGIDVILLTMEIVQLPRYHRYSLFLFPGQFSCGFNTVNFAADAFKTVLSSSSRSGILGWVNFISPY